MNLPQFEKDQGISAKDIVPVMRKQYRKYDKPLHSKLKRPDAYGICLLPKAAKFLKEAFPTARKRENRRLSHRVQFRLSEWHYEALQRVLKEKYGFSTTQDGLSYIVVQFLNQEGQANENNKPLRITHTVCVDGTSGLCRRGK